jgi:hydroxymethylbilane synthase
MPDTLRLGTRRSQLALTQSGMIARELERRLGDGTRVELVPIVTSGDVYRGDLAEVGGKGLFTLELENGLRDGSIDLAVHSLKDLPVELPPELAVAAFPERADPRDALISDDGDDLDALPAGAVVLTGSLRRRSQVLARRPDLEVRAIRGNVDTRIEKWRALGVPGGVLLAQAGLDRLGDRLEARRGGGLPIHPLPPEQLLPAPGQGILAVETRAGSEAEARCRVLEHADSARAARAERRVVAVFGGDCTLPLAAWARPAEGGGGELVVSGLLATPDGERIARGEGRHADPEAAADACIAAMREHGADEVLARIAEMRPAGAAK